MKVKLLTATLALLLTQTTFAAGGTRPFTCPSVDTLKNIGISAITDGDGPSTNEWYGIVLSNRYGTNVDWTFAIGGFEGKYRSEILAKANAAISTLTLVEGPSKTGRGGDARNEWICTYASSDKDVRVALAITPPENFSTSEFAKLMRK